MAAPNMATITASLERSLQNCSLNQHSSSNSSGEASSGLGIGIGMAARSSSSASSSPDDNRPENDHLPNTDTTLELNSHISLPYHWEQCLDLKTGEIYYINWRNGMKAKEDPRTTAEYSGGYYSEEDSSYDSEESSSESSPPPSSCSRGHYPRVEKDHVLVVAGCKSCLMYFMVPKHVEDCPKCNGQLLHFDRSENDSP
ncbi:protein CURLY FLAG LEAF 1 [Ziziphus jujuba]|uniref:Protein CURLY FLAG LEAF 1 n=1 Tax=Ziziphus jujuba TaxID=326968 RepID=A0A6P4BSK6_ZIZJJ|nr:protein CURLY FLAG LEAF 1 [Ziziphus jujuba]